MNRLSNKIAGIFLCTATIIMNGAQPTNEGWVEVKRIAPSNQPADEGWLEMEKTDEFTQPEKEVSIPQCESPKMVTPNTQVICSSYTKKQKISNNRPICRIPTKQWTVECFLQHNAPPSGTEWKTEAREAWRLGYSKSLSTEATRLIQEYLIPSVRFKIINTDCYKDQVGITFQSEQTGDKLGYFLLYQNPKTSGSPYYRDYYLDKGIRPGESGFKFLVRQAKEKGEFFKHVVDLPLVPIRILVEQPEHNRTLGYIKLHPAALKKIKKIQFDGDRPAYAYTDGDWEWGYYEKH